MIVHHFLKDFANKEVLPQTIDELICFYGFGKKTACLLLDAMGLTKNQQAGIPVDQHLAPLVSDHSDGLTTKNGRNQ